MKLLLIKTSSYGDIIHCFPALSYLRQKFPDAQIDWVVEGRCSSLLQALPGVDNLLIVESRKWRKAPRKSRKEFVAFKKQLQSTQYDIAFDLQGNIKSGLLLGLTKATKKIGFGWGSLPEWPNGLFTNGKVTPPPGKNIREDYLFLVQSAFGEQNPCSEEEVVFALSEEEKRYLESLSDKSFRVLVAPGANWPNKELPFAKLLKTLEEIASEKETFFYFSWGTEREKELSQKLSDHFSGQAIVLDRLSLPLLQNVMRQMDLVVAMDSLLLHLCGTTKTASLSFFGPSRAAKYGPLARISHQHSSRFGQTDLPGDKERPEGRVKLTLPRGYLKSDGETDGQSGRTVGEKCGLGPQHRFIQKECPYGVIFEGRCPKLRSCKTGACLKGD